MWDGNSDFREVFRVMWGYMGENWVLMVCKSEMAGDGIVRIGVGIGV